MAVNPFAGCEMTIKFTRTIDRMFDSLNRRHAKEGIRIGGADLAVIQSSLEWLEQWNAEVGVTISSDEFLTDTTAEGLRVTLLSTKKLCKELLQNPCNNCSFKYILTNRMNQDALEVHF